jgi:hypothetical protein
MYVFSILTLYLLFLFRNNTQRVIDEVCEHIDVRTQIQWWDSEKKRLRWYTVQVKQYEHPNTVTVKYKGATYIVQTNEVNMLCIQTFTYHVF